MKKLLSTSGENCVYRTENGDNRHHVNDAAACCTTALVSL